VAIGILLILDDPYQLNPREPEWERIVIGFVGACLGYGLFQVQAMQKIKASEQKTDK